MTLSTQAVLASANANNSAETSTITTPWADADAWASDWFTRLLHGTLSEDEFEQTVASQWAKAKEPASSRLHAPGTARQLLALAMSPHQTSAGYAHEAPGLGFQSQWLVGKPGLPGAIHIQAPAERHPHGGLGQLNRPVHQHDSGRVALITQGEAVFHVARPGDNGERLMQALPVRAGDLLFWPRWTPHTFDACSGFALVSAMARYVSPAADGFVFPV